MTAPVTLELLPYLNDFSRWSEPQTYEPIFMNLFCDSFLRSAVTTIPSKVGQTNIYIIKYYLLVRILF